MNLSEWLDTLPEEQLEELGEIAPDVVNRLVGLNPPQLSAVLALDGPIQINAVAGSGKTRVLTHRIMYMKYKGIKPNNIFCTTFTKKATGEMIERLSKLVPAMFVQQMTIGTTHAIGYRILNREYQAMKHHLAGAFRRDKDVLMNSAQKYFMEAIKKDLMKSPHVSMKVKEELNDIAIPQFTKAIGLAKNEGIDNRAYEMMHAGSTDRMEAYILMYNAYEQRKWDECVVDGDDLLFLLWKLLKENPDILAKYRRVYKYFLVDETQDNNNIQSELIDMLAYPENNIFVVGDDDQSMYAFRGAMPKNFIEFKKRHPTAQMIYLEDNYRSKPGILELANRLISKNTERIVKKLKANKKDTSDCHSYSHYKDESEEAAGTVSEIRHLVEAEGRKHKDITILYRTNAQSRAFEDQLIMQGLPYVIHGGISFYERREVKDLVAYLQMVVDPNDFKAFERIYNVPKRYLGKAFLQKVKNYRGTAWQALSDQSFLRGLSYEKNGVEELKDLILKLQGMHKAGKTPEDIIDVIINEGGYEKYLKEDGEEEDEGNSRMENVNTLKYAIQRFEKVEDFLSYIMMMTTTAKHDINGVQLMTIHKSKGLEFPVAFVVGMNEGTLPHFRAVEAVESGEKPLAVEEERRLGYVAVTRAESFVYLSSSYSFNGRSCKRSRFIDDMEPLTKKGQEQETKPEPKLTWEPLFEGDLTPEEYEDMQKQEATYFRPATVDEDAYLDEMFPRREAEEERKAVMETLELEG